MWPECRFGKCKRGIPSTFVFIVEDENTLTQLMESKGTQVCTPCRVQSAPQLKLQYIKYKH